MILYMSKLIKSSNYHLVNNFPKDFSIFRRAISNIAFFILTTKITVRSNLLTKEDKILAKKVIKKGDVVLVGDFRRLFRFFTGDFFTHTLLYTGNDQCIHANVDGVSTTSFDKLFEEYDTLLIMRPKIKNNFRQTIENVIAVAYKKLGMAYNFYFEYRHDRYICTQLIESSFLESGFNLNIRDKYKSKKGRFAIFSRIRRIVKADDFLKGNFQIIYTSKAAKRQSHLIKK